MPHGKGSDDGWPGSAGTDSSQTTLFELWLAFLAGRGAADRTIAGYRRDVARFLTMAPHFPVTAAAVMAFREELVMRGASPGSAARAVSAVRGFCRFLTDRGVEVEPAVFSLSSPSQHPGDGPPALSAEAAAKVLNLVQHLSDDPHLALRDTALFALLFEAGLSIGEALSLPRAAAFTDGPVTVRRGKRTRTLVLAPMVREKLRRYAVAGTGGRRPAETPQGAPADQPLFLGVRGKPLDAGVVQRQMRRLRSLLQLPPGTTTAALRQALARGLKEAGYGWAALQAKFGHRHRSSVRRLVRRRTGLRDN